MNKEQMSGKERLLAALRMQETDRIPVSPCTVAYSLDAFPDQAAHHVTDVMKEAGHDVWASLITNALSCWVPLPDSGIVPFTKWENGDQLTGYETPVGTIYERNRSVGHSAMNVPVKHLVETVEDLKVYKYYLEHTFLWNMDNSDFYEYEAKKVGDDGLIADAILTASPFSDFVVYKAGIDHTYYLKLPTPFGVMNLDKSIL